MSSNYSVSPFQGKCPAPFLDESLFGDGGYIDGRFCSPFTANLSCCIPCPVSDWLYPDNFNQVTRAAEWVNVVSMICSVFLLMSFIFLPVAYTHRHYLSVALTISIIVMQMGFLIPLGAKPNQCFDAITPNDMRTSIVCALSGTFLLLGGWASLMWVLVRSLALHLQICWQVVIGKGFMYGAYVLSWGLPAIGVAVALILSGVSFRFGDTCHLNHQHSFADFWVPLLVFSGITLLIQFATFGYCIKVYLASLNSSEPSSSTNSSALPSYTTSIRTVNPKQAYRRVRRVLELQWRGISVVLVIVTDVIFFSVVFVFMDNGEQEALHSKTKALPWITCMVAGLGKNYCLQYTKSFIVNEATVMAVLMLLSFNGIWALLLLGRLSILRGWYDTIKERFGRRGGGEFVSADAAFAGRDVKSYEMLDSPGADVKEPEPIARTLSQLTVEPMSPLIIETPFSPLGASPLGPSPLAASPVSPPPRAGRQTPDYFGREARYAPPSRSFSTPRPPSAGGPSNRPPRSHSHVAFPGMDPLAMNRI